MAERVRVELTREFPPYRISSAAPSATRPSLREGDLYLGSAKHASQKICFLEADLRNGGWSCATHGYMPDGSHTIDSIDTVTIRNFYQIADLAAPHRLSSKRAS